jgi:two-component system, OmpR family, copper resistance phosphate regulon response regulator CusR
LIVVDEPDTMLQFQRDLEAGGYQTVLAADADTALERLATLPVDVVVLDVMMPVRDGWTVLEALQSRVEPPPTIIVSARAGPIQLERASRMGAASWMAAPISAADLRQAVREALAGAGT